MILDTRRLPILETERLRLDPVTVGDGPAVFALMDHPEVMAYWDGPPVHDPDVAAAMVQSQVAVMAEGGGLYWVIRSLADRAVLGCCEIAEIDRRHKRGEAGFLLGRDAWGRGYALEAVQALVAYAAASGLRKLSARTQLGDRRAETLLRRLGFCQEGLLRGHVLRDGERRDCHLFGLLL